MYETLLELLTRRPFRQFEIHLSNGTVHLVKHFDFAELLKSKIVIALPETDQIAVCFLLHMVEVRVVAKS